ncbi:MAG TPA: serine hydrolase [Urbifossiella sp.]|jgi:CubicO group peptidase (beta-lactamase class C family)
MHTNFRWLILLALVFPSPCSAADVETAAVDRVIADALKVWDVPGAALVVVRNDQVILLKGYGKKSLDKPDPVSPDTLFPLASCTKAFTSTLLAMLVDEGKIGWDDRVRDHLPGFKLSDPNADAMVNLRDLLSHRTGVLGHDLLWYHAPWSIDDTLAKVDRLPLSYPFRAGFDYNSIMYMAAGRAAARRGGEPWEKLVKERIAGPLGMTGLRFTTTEIPADADRATGHQKLAKDGKIVVMPEYPMTEPNPAGSIHASARDLGAWVKFHLAGGTVNGKRLVSEKNLRETVMPQNIIRLENNARAMNPDTVQLSYGLGWVVADHRGKRVIAHGGQIDGIRVQITLLPDEKLGFAILNNLHETRMNQAVTNTLIDLYCGLSPRDWNGFFLKIVAEAAAKRQAAINDREKARIPATKPSLPLAAYAGEYADDVYGKLKVNEKDGRLSIEWSGFKCPLEHFQNDAFRITEGYFAEKLAVFGGSGAQVKAVNFAGILFKRE